jgi:surfeit locus 1 family protein
LVNRGFVPWYGSREKLVDIAVSEAKVSIQVRLIKPKERIKFKQNNSTTFPMLIQSLNIERLSHLLDYQLIAMLAQLDVKSDNGFMCV